MTPRRLQLGLTAYAGLCGLVLANLFLMQGGRSGQVVIGASPEAAIKPPVRALSTQPVVTVPMPGTAALETARAVQRELSARGYVMGANDGAVSLVTRAAIMAYEADHGLGLTGEPSEALLQRIILGQATADAAGPVSAKIGPQADQVIRTAQQSLLALNYGPLKVDGFVGDATVQAILKFERAHGMPESGRVSGGLIMALAKLAALGHVQMNQ